MSELSNLRVVLGTLKPVTAAWPCGPSLSRVMGTLSIDTEEEAVSRTLKEKMLLVLGIHFHEDALVLSKRRALL